MNNMGVAYQEGESNMKGMGYEAMGERMKRHDAVVHGYKRQNMRLESRKMQGS